MTYKDNTVRLTFTLQSTAIILNKKLCKYFLMPKTDSAYIFLRLADVRL